MFIPLRHRPRLNVDKLNKVFFHKLIFNGQIYRLFRDRRIQKNT